MKRHLKLGGNVDLTRSMPCPACGYNIECNAQVSETGETSAPKKGDVGVCFRCCAFLRFDDDKILKLSDDEFIDLDEETRRTCLAIATAITAARNGVKP